MRIVQVTFGFPPYQIGGTVHLSHLLSVGLARRKNVDVFVFSGGLPLETGVGSREEIQNGLSIFWIQTKKPAFRNLAIPNVDIHTFKNPAIERIFEQYMAKVRPDIVHFQHTIQLSSSLISMAKQHAKRVVVSLQDFWYFCPRIHLLKLDETVCSGPELGLNCFYCREKEPSVASNVSFLRKVKEIIPSKIQRSAGKGLKSLIVEKRHGRTIKNYKKIFPFIFRYHYVMEMLKLSDIILSPSHFLKRKYTSTAGIEQNKILVVPLGIIPFAVIEKKSSDLPVRFGYAGLPGRYKGSHLVLNAFKNIAEDKAKLVIWGKGWDSISRNYGNSKNIIFMGEYSNERIGEVFSSFDVLIVPSIWGETFSFIAHEAFFARVPVIASNIGVFGDIINDGKNGLLFDRNDEKSLFQCMQRIVENPALIAEFKKNILEPKTADYFVDEIFDIYEDLLKSG